MTDSLIRDQRITRNLESALMTIDLDGYKVYKTPTANMIATAAYL